MRGSKFGRRSLRCVFLCLLLLTHFIVLFGTALENEETEATETCETSPSFWGTTDSTSASASASGCGDTDTVAISLKEFLQTAVFGQGKESSSSEENDKTDPQDKQNGNVWHRPFLSFLENHQKRKERPVLSFLQASLNGSKPEGETENENENETNPNTKKGGNPFLSFLDAIQQTKAAILGEGHQEKGTKQNENAVLAKVLEKARLLAQQDEEANAIGTKEFLAIMKSALQKVAKQLQDNFGELLSSTTLMDAYIALAIPYFAMFHDAKNSPLSKRKLHRFYPTVTKDEWIDLHDALYLSHLAYVDTIQQFEEGLEAFDGNSWTKLYGTTESKPDLPSSFLLIHKEIDPMDRSSGSSSSKSKQQNPLESMIQESLVNLGMAKPQSEVLVSLVVRGTKHAADLLQDGLLEPEDYRGGYAHSGILASGKNLAKQYLPKLKDIHDITERDKVKVILIGHSLGAGAAVIAGMELREHDFLDVEVVGFGCPSLLSRDLSESTKDYITTVVNDADIVSRMSGASMTNILLDLMDYDWTQDALEDLEFSLERARESFPDFASFFPDTQKALEWFETRLNEVVRPNLLQRKNTQQTERLPSVLIPPGTCIHLFRDGYGVTGTYTPCDFFSSVEFSLTLLDDHLIPTGYNRALLAAAQDTDRDYSFQFTHDINGIIGV